MFIPKTELFTKITPVYTYIRPVYTYPIAGYFIGSEILAYLAD